MGRYVTDEEVQEQKLNQEQYEMQVYQEAVFVGLTFLPVWMLIQRFTAFTNINSLHKDKLDIFLAGSAYHLIAESSGLNAFYLQHGAAVKKIFSNTLEGVADGSVVISDIERLCNNYPNRNC
jgi:hypothetical protein